MNHAVEILMAREWELRTLIRTCAENSHRIMADINVSMYREWLAEIEVAIKLLTMNQPADAKEQK